MTANGITSSALAQVAERTPASIVSLRALKGAARRRRRVWVSAALIGLLLGAGIHKLIPRTYAAVSDAYLVQPSGSDRQQGMASDNSLLQTRSVATKALEALHINTPVSKFLSSYRGSVVSEQILAISFRATSPAEAIAYNRAVANAFLAFRASVYTQQSQVLVNGLTAQSTALESQINKLTQSITALSTGSATSQSSNQVANLVNQRSSDESHVAQLQAQIQQDQIDLISITRGSDILDPPAVNAKSTKKIAITDALSGLVAGLGLGLAIVLIGAVLSDKLSRREDIAFALGVPVELSIRRYRRPRLMRKTRLRRRMKRLDPQLHMVEHRLRAHMQGAPGSALTTVAIESAEPAALVVGSLALSLASEGKRVAVIDMAEGRPLAALLRSGFQNRVTVIEAPEDPAQIATVGSEDADATLLLVSPDPALGADHIATWATVAVLLVAGGRANATRMTAAAQMLRVAGISLKAAYLIGGERDDESLGLVLPVYPAPTNGKHDPELHWRVSPR